MKFHPAADSTPYLAHQKLAKNNVEQDFSESWLDHTAVKLQKVVVGISAACTA